MKALKRFWVETPDSSGWAHWERDTIPAGETWRNVPWKHMPVNFPGTWEVEYRVYSPGDTPDTGWYLYGPDGSPFGKWLAPTIRDALRVATDYIYGDRS
jgi:hypothetical protein